MSKTECTDQLPLFEVGKQVVTADFEGGQVVTDAGLLAIRKLDLELGVLAGAAAILPDPRAQKQVTHTRQQLLAQRVYQALAGYFDGNDASFLRDDPLFQTLAGVSPADEQPLASGSTANRFLNASTRRDSELPLEERPVLFEVRQAQLERVRRMNEYFVDLFIRTRRKRPERIIIDLDPTDDPAHGQQQLTFWHGYYQQNQYLPLLAFDGDSRMPLAAWLRPGTVGTHCGTVVDVLREIVAHFRRVWPEVPIFIRGDEGVGGPEMYEYCEGERLLYANAAIPEIATSEVQAARLRLFKVGALVQTSVRRMWFRFSSTWPKQDVFRRACEEVGRFAAEVRTTAETLCEACLPRAAGDAPVAATNALK